MASPLPTSETTLRLSRTYRAPREEVFRAWTDPKALERWFAPSRGFVTNVPLFELRPGGRYRVELRRGDASHVVVGQYREIRQPERLVNTWRWENHPERGTEDTIVTVEFIDRGRSTELVLTHEKFETIESRDEHDKGWNGCLEQLGRYVSERSAS